MAKCGYSCTTEGAVSLSASTAKTIIGVKANAAFGVDLKKYRISFTGITASDNSILVELMYSTWATNGTMGTNNTATTPHQTYGRALTHGVTSGAAWTSEPTVLTALDSWTLTPNQGTAIYDIPLGDTFDCAFSEGFAIRCTPGAALTSVSARASLHWERC